MAIGQILFLGEGVLHFLLTNMFHSIQNVCESGVFRSKLNTRAHY